MQGGLEGNGYSFASTTNTLSRIKSYGKIDTF